MWTAFETEGLGASLQHNQMVAGVEEEAKKMWDLPQDWILLAQLVFGGLASKDPVPAKPKLPITETTRTYGKE
jgi:uncharacterized protein